MIPKKIHYIWPGRDKKKGLAAACLPTWTQVLSDEWEIIEWNLDTFDFEEHRKKNKFFREVTDKKLFAFIADYIRVHVLYENGGVYLDTDVSLLKEFTDEMLENKMFLAIQNEKLVEPAIMGAEKGHPFLKALVDFYETGVWRAYEYILPDVFAKLLNDAYGITGYPQKSEQQIFSTEDGNITFYPEKYFIPYRQDEQYLPSCVEPETTAIHWFRGSWVDKPELKFLKNKCPMDKFKRKYCNLRYILKFLFAFKFNPKKNACWIRLFGIRFSIMRDSI